MPNLLRERSGNISLGMRPHHPTRAVSSPRRLHRAGGTPTGETLPHHGYSLLPGMRAHPAVQTVTCAASSAASRFLVRRWRVTLRGRHALYSPWTPNAAVPGATGREASEARAGRRTASREAGEPMATILSERLQAAIESAARLPRGRQDELAARIEALLDEGDEAVWEAAFADPRSAAFFAELAAEADGADTGPRQPFPKPAGWTEADEAYERELDRLAGVPTPEEAGEAEGDR
jgi:hypothetical protein